jgi:hypothetical protein
MKKRFNVYLYASISLSIWTSSCNTKYEPVEDNKIELQGERALSGLKPNDFETIVIDGCEYIVFTESFNHAAKGYGFMAHKGNCKNNIHIYRKLD